MKVKTKHGEGVVLRIDDTTYSIWIYVIKLLTGEEIAITRSEFTIAKG